MSKAATVKLTLRVTPMMHARIKRARQQMALPSDSDLMRQAVAQFLELRAARLGEVYAEIPDEREQRLVDERRRAGLPTRSYKLPRR